MLLPVYCTRVHFASSAQGTVNRTKRIVILRVYRSGAATGKWGKETSNWKTPIHLGLRKACLSRTCLVRLEWSQSSMGKRLNCTGNLGDSIASSQRAKQMPVMYSMVIHGRTNHHQLVRENPLVTYHVFASLRVQANVTDRHMEVVPWSRLLTLAAVSNRKHRFNDPSSIQLNYPVLGA